MLMVPVAAGIRIGCYAGLFPPASPIRYSFKKFNLGDVKITKDEY